MNMKNQNSKAISLGLAALLAGCTWHPSKIAMQPVISNSSRTDTYKTLALIVSETSRGYAFRVRNISNFDGKNPPVKKHYLGANQEYILETYDAAGALLSQYNIYVPFVPGANSSSGMPLDAVINADPKIASLAINHNNEKTFLNVDPILLRPSN
jgi:hypothetical protein